MFEHKRPLRVFLFHAPADKVAARHLYLRLLQDGVDAWLVKEKLLPGQDWKQELDHAFRESDAVVICISNRFMRSEFERKEVRLALDAVVEQLQEETFLVLARLEGSDTPESLTRWPAVDLTAAGGYERLLDDLRLRASQVEASLQPREVSLPELAGQDRSDEQPIPEEAPLEAALGRPEIIEGAGILIEDPAVQRYQPGRAVLLSLLGFALLLMLALFGPSWIEQSSPATSTPELKTPRAWPTLTEISPSVTSRLRPIPTLASKGNISQIVFLIDTSGSMRGRRITIVKSAVTDYVARLSDRYWITVIAFDTNVELRMPPTQDRARANEAVETITVELPHDGSCVVDAFSAGIQEGSFRPTANESEMMVILLTDAAVGDNVGWNCTLRYTDDLLTLVWNQPIPIFSIYVGEDYEPNSFLTWTAGEGAVRPATTEKKIEETLLSISEAAGLEMNAEPATSVPTTNAQPVNMVFVPAGEFIMGDNHTVSLDAFWIDKTEVTNGMYAVCVEAGACQLPRSERSNTRDPYYGIGQFEDYPVVHVSWNDASAYCAWVGGRLPTEAEWEKAARGTDGRQFPWGDADPRGIQGLLNFQGQDTTAVGSYPDGASRYGALDMAGNVSEWVADWFSPAYYNNPPASNPLGPESGEYRVWRGGSWANTSVERVFTYSRTGNLPTDSSGGIGFRCARDAGP